MTTVVLNTQELLHEICDQKRFHKEPTGPLLEFRNWAGDSMFTAYTKMRRIGESRTVF